MISPLVVIVTAYVSGIIFGKMVSLPLWLSFCLLVFLLLVSFHVLLANKQSIFIFLLALIFALGVTYVQLRNISLPSIPNGKIELVGQVVNEPSVFEDRISFILQSKQGKFSVMAPLGEVSYGDKVWVRGFASEIEALENPGIFSFKDYLEKQGIGARLIAKE